MVAVFVFAPIFEPLNGSYIEQYVIAVTAGPSGEGFFMEPTPREHLYASQTSWREEV